MCVQRVALNETDERLDNIQKREDERAYIERKDERGRESNAIRAGQER